MRILLIKPINDRYCVVQPPLGLGYLAAVVHRCGHRAEILDAGRVRLTWKGFVDLIDWGRYDLIGFQMFSYELPSVKKHLEIVKRRSPGTVTLVGGPHISGDPEGTASYLEGMDFGFAGEAEAGLGKFLRLEWKDYSDPARLDKIPNLVWRRGGRTAVNPRAPVLDPDDIPLPAWDLIDPRNYPPAVHGIFYRYRPIAPIVTSRGCPFPCTFCAGRAVTGTVLRYRSVENVIGEILLLRDKFGVREFHIEDDNFTGKRDYVIEFCREVIARAPGLAFALPNGIRLDTLDREVLTLMERAGFYSIAVGIESGSGRVLKLMKKNLTPGLVREKTDLIRECTGMRLSGFFLIGYPGETEEEILETIAFALSLKLDLASFLITIPLPGSPLWEEYGRPDYSGVEWADFVPSRAIPGVSGIPPRRLKQLQRQATIRFYLRPGVVWRLAREIRGGDQLRIIRRRLLDIILPRGDK
jgi:anaerobic magnesium-protoporphyrin IX monomethyl ester cyclase